MSTETFIQLVLFWYGFGMLSFLFWVKKFDDEFEFDALTIFMMLLSGLLGFLSWPVNYYYSWLSYKYNFFGFEIK